MTFLKYIPLLKSWPMYKKIFLVIGHIAFWGLSFYVITRIFGISTVEIIEEDNNGIEERQEN